MNAVPSETEWRALCERLADKVPFQLLTVLEVDWDKALVRRLYSSDEEHYPSGGVKRLMETAWGRQVLREGRVLRADGPDEMKAAFADHELLHSLGLTHALNVPVMREGRVAWTLNLLRGHPPFDDDEVALRVPAVLLQASARRYSVSLISSITT